MNALSRRHFIRQAGAVAVVAGAPQLALANANTDARFVLMILRGGLDGLAAVPAYGDPNYRSRRGELVLEHSGSAKSILALDSTFGLHPALQELQARYVANEVVVVHAVATPYRERSHFDGQDVLENGTSSALATRDGWLNRALAAMPDVLVPTTTGGAAIALALTTPLVLQGDVRVSSWAPSRMPGTDDGTLDRIARMYAPEPFFADRLEQARATDELAGDSMGRAQNRRSRGNRELIELARAAGTFLSADGGPRIAVIEAGGWDTHANQGAATGSLANRLEILDESLLTLRQSLGDAWQSTAIIVATEFGRTVAINGTRGTDHGTAGCAFLLGGAVNGGRVLTDWPGLANRDLHEGRDLRPTTDLRAVIKGALHDHLQVSANALAQDVFPDSSRIKPISGLIAS